MLKKIAVLFLLCLPSLLVAQIKLPSEPCRLELADAPLIRGLHLGMSPSEAEKLLGLKLTLTKKLDVDYFFENLGAASVKESGMHRIEVDTGVKLFDYYAFKTKNVPASLMGVNGLLLSFYNDTLYSIYIDYSQSDGQWKDSKEFAQILSEKANLPKQSWSFSDDNGGSYLFCSGFSVVAKVKNDRPIILLQDKKIQSEVDAKKRKLINDEQQRIKDAALEKKRRFKP